MQFVRCLVFFLKFEPIFDFLPMFRNVMKSVILTDFWVKIGLFGKYKHFSQPLFTRCKKAYIRTFSRSRDLSRAKLGYANLKRTYAKIILTVRILKILLP